MGGIKDRVAGIGRVHKFGERWDAENRLPLGLFDCGRAPTERQRPFIGKREP